MLKTCSTVWWQSQPCTIGAVQTLVLASVGAASKAFMHILNSTHVEGGHILEQALQRPSGQVRARALARHTTSCKQQEILVRS